MTLRQKRAQALQKGRTLADAVKARGGSMTDAERTELKGYADEVTALDAQIDQAEADEALIKAMGESTQPGQLGDQDKFLPKSLGDHWAHYVKSKLGTEGFKGLAAGNTLAAPELLVPGMVKAATDTHVVGGTSGAYGPMVTDLDTNFVMPFRRRLTIADLLTPGSVSGNTIQYPVFGVLEGGTGPVGEAGAKPQLHVTDPTWRNDSLAEIAGWFSVSDDMAEDMAYMVSEINTTAVYDLQLKEEAQLLSGTGTGNTLLGILNRSGVQAATKGADTPADAIFKALTQVQAATGYAADGVVINPADYEALRLGKDSNGQYYAGGYFGGAYGNGGIEENPPVWGRRTVVTTATPQGKVIIGAWATAKLFGKGGIRVESTNSHADDFTHDRITTRLRKRVGLQVKYPSAFVSLDLSA